MHVRNIHTLAAAGSSTAIGVAGDDEPEEEFVALEESLDSVVDFASLLLISVLAFLDDSPLSLPVFPMGTTIASDIGGSFDF